MKNENAEAVWWIAGTQQKDNFFSKAIFNSDMLQRLQYYASLKGSSFLKRLKVYPVIPSIIAIMNEKMETLNSNLEVGSSIR